MSIVDKIRNALDAINKKHAKEIKDDRPVIFIAGEHPELTEVQFQSTGIVAVDSMLGGGIPKGMVTNVHGSPWSGKTAFCLGVASQLAKEGKYTLYVNLESIPLKTYAGFLDLDLNYVVQIEPRLTAEHLIEDIEELIYDKSTRTPKNMFDLVIIDSINNLHTDAKEKAWLEGVDKIPQMASRAKLIDDFLTRIYGKGMLRGGASLLTITQDRANIAGASMPMAPKTTMSGGESIKYNAKVTLKVSRKVNSKKTGQTVFIEVEKNSTTGELGKCEFGVMYKLGIDDSQTLSDKAIEYGYLQSGSKRGSYLLIIPGLGDIEIAGKQAVVDFIKDNPPVAQVMRAVLTGKKPAFVAKEGYDYIDPSVDLEKED